jgi:hypothetical protein
MRGRVREIALYYRVLPSASLQWPLADPIALLHHPFCRASASANQPRRNFSGGMLDR